jgi:hypothetical protein
MAISGQMLAQAQQRGAERHGGPAGCRADAATVISNIPKSRRANMTRLGGFSP